MNDIKWHFLRPFPKHARNYTILWLKFLRKTGFFRQFLQAPMQIGSICPSSRFLTHALASLALSQNGGNGLIVDLGAGSGVVSRELLRIGVCPERILAIDISSSFIHVFRRHCPNLQLHVGDARDLGKMVDTFFPGQPVMAVISSLPLRSMPGETIRQIMNELRHVLMRNNGILVQFTYALWLHSRLEPFGFSKKNAQYVFLNVPPALVEAYNPEE